MGFLQPLALLGLVAVGIPPLLHLLDRRHPPLVVFPAVRYLVATEREHSRRLRLRNLLLLILRMAVLLLLVLAAARPVVRFDRGRGHDPTALGLVLDNSLSSGTVAEGTTRWSALAGLGRSIVARLTLDDGLWMATASGDVTPFTRAQALALLDTLQPVARRLDVTGAVQALAGALDQAPQPQREIVVLSDGQATAFTGAMGIGERTVLILRPAADAPNRGIDSVGVERLAGGTSHALSVAVGGSGDRSAVELVIGGRTIARTVARPGEVALLEAELSSGWHAAEIVLDPDELRADDRWWVAVRVDPPPGVAVGSAVGSFLPEAMAVLAEAGHVRAGDDVRVADRFERAPAIVLPPADAALLGAVNRALSARGIRWQFGPTLEGSWILEDDFPGLEGATLVRRHALGGTGGDVLATAGGQPWLVRDGEVVLVASRLDPEWTDLVVRAGFIPFVHTLVNRVGAGSGWIVRGRPGDVVGLPAGGRALLAGDARWPVAPDNRIRSPSEPGVYYVAGARGDTVGALEVNHDPRESAAGTVDAALTRAALGPGARLVDATALDRDLFAGARRADLSSLLLVAALLVAVAELLVATLGRRSREV